MFSVSVSQSQGGEVIAERALPADTGRIGTLRGIWAVGEGSCLSEPHGRLPGRGGPELTAQMGCLEPQRRVGLWALVLGWGRAEDAELSSRGRSGYCHGSSQGPGDRHKPTGRPTSQLKWAGFLCLISLFHCLLPPHTITVRKFFLISDLHPFCQLLASGWRCATVETVGAWGSVRLDGVLSPLPSVSLLPHL